MKAHTKLSLSSLKEIALPYATFCLLIVFFNDTISYFSSVYLFFFIIYEYRKLVGVRIVMSQEYYPHVFFRRVLPFMNLCLLIFSVEYSICVYCIKLVHENYDALERS